MVMSEQPAGHHVVTEPAYTYNAAILRWVDGDTVDMRVDVGFRIWKEDRFRLWGVDTPERGEPGYHEARSANEVLAPVGTHVVVRTYTAPDKYGRWLAEVWVDGVEVGAHLLRLGLAVPYHGGTRSRSELEGR